MSQPIANPLEAILHLCAEATPNPWYPSAYARETGISRDSLDPSLDELRMAGLVRLTDWVKENGQGYALTEEGQRVVQSPRELAKVRGGKLASRPVRQEEPADSLDSEATSFGRGEVIRNALLSPVRPVVSRALLALNIAWFVVGLALALQRQIPPERYLTAEGQPALQLLHELGALGWGDLERGQWWRLLTCCFVHFGALHLAVNMYGLYVLGQMLESMWGHGRFLLLYLVAGFGGSCTMAYLNAAKQGFLGAGASGALWGMMTAEAAWIVLNRSFLPRQLVTAWLRQLILVFLINAWISTWPGISAAAHFGGGAVGLVAAVLLHVQRFGRGWERRLALAGVLALPVLCVGVLLRGNAVPPREEAVEPRAPVNRELRELVEHYLPQIEPDEKRALRVYTQLAVPRLKEDPKERNPKEVQTAVAGLEMEQDKLTKAADLLKKAGPYQDAGVEQLRLARTRLLDEEAGLLKQAERCLREDSDWADVEFDRQRRRVEQLQERWKKLTRAPAR